MSLPVAIAIERISVLKEGRVWTGECLSPLFATTDSPLAAATAFLMRLHSQQQLFSQVVDAVIVPCPRAPLASSGDSHPEFDAIAYQLRLRWDQPPRRIRVFWPTRAYARHFGGWTGSNDRPCLHKIGHDLLVSKVTVAHWERIKSNEPHCKWTSEKKLQSDAARGTWSDPLPDAVLHSGHHVTAIEIGGQYSADWIRHHVRRFERAAWEWELW